MCMCFVGFLFFIQMCNEKYHGVISALCLKLSHYYKYMGALVFVELISCRYQSNSNCLNLVPLKNPQDCQCYQWRSLWDQRKRRLFAGLMPLQQVPDPWERLLLIATHWNVKLERSMVWLPAILPKSYFFLCVFLTKQDLTEKRYW